MITRRFLVTPALARLVSYYRGSTPVIEGFFQEPSDRSVLLRIDRQGPKLVLSIPHRDQDPEETAADIPTEHALVLLSSCAGKLSFNQSGLTLEGGQEALVQRFNGFHAFATVSVTFPDRKSADGLVCPVWFGAEVTDDTALTNRGLALGGMPRLGELSISDLALNAIMDVLESQPKPAQEPGTTDVAGAGHSGTGLPVEILSTLTVGMERSTCDTGEDGTNSEKRGALAATALKPRSSFARFQNGLSLTRAGSRPDEPGAERAAES